MVTRPLYRILVVDDDAEACFLVQELLGDATHINPVVDTASSPKEAMAALKRGRYHLLLLDHNLGATTGLELFTEIRAAGFNQPAIMLSGFGNKDLASKARRAGMEDYIDKKDLTTNLLEKAIQLAVMPVSLTPVQGMPVVPRVPIPGGETRMLLQEVLELNKQFVHATTENTQELKGLRQDFKTLNGEMKDMNRKSHDHFRDTAGMAQVQQSLLVELEKSKKHWAIKILDWIKDNKNVSLSLGIAVVVFALLAVIVSQTLNTKAINQIINPSAPTELGK